MLPDNSLLDGGAGQEIRHDGQLSTARAFELLGQIQEGVQVREYLPSTFIDCGKDVEHIEYTRENPRGDQKGFQHTDGTSMEDTRRGYYGVHMNANPALFDALAPFTQQRLKLNKGFPHSLGKVFPATQSKDLLL